MTTIIKTLPKIQSAEIAKVFQAQVKNAPNIAQTNHKERIAKLKKIGKWMAENLDLIQDAMYRDFKKPPTEVIIGETIGVQNELSKTIKNLKKWMKPQKVSATLTVLGTNSYIQYEPKGVCLIISPWNYPFNLTIKPLISCIAAGNTAIIKPSEMTPHTSGMLKKMLSDLFSSDEVCIFEGGVETAQELLAKPFNHIFFTGSPKVGKIVMAAAAKHLASVTLELGGKSPTIMDKTANIKDTAQRMAWGKFLNNGQTCIAPDYVLAHETIKDELVEHLGKSVNHMYNPDGAGIEKSADYCRIVNKRHYDRVKQLLDDAVAKGAKIEFGGEVNEADNYIAPTVLTNVNDDMKLMQQEIFGPLLPIATYQKEEQVLEAINARPKPLALYIFTKSKKIKNYFLKRTSAGGMVVNDNLIHYSHGNLPFGGVNNSGIGKSGGFYGFQAFSNMKGVVEQKYGTLKPLFPPYTNRVKKLVKTMVKWL